MPFRFAMAPPSISGGHQLLAAGRLWCYLSICVYRTLRSMLSVDRSLAATTAR